MDVEHLIDVVVCAEDVTRGPPDPQPVIVAVAALTIDSSAWVAVSHSCADMVSASVAGVDAVGAAWDPTARWRCSLPARLGSSAAAPSWRGSWGSQVVTSWRRIASTCSAGTRACSMSQRRAPP